MKIQESTLGGRGVFATQDYISGETIEVCPVIKLTQADRKTIDTTALYDYYYAWGDNSDEAAIALGFGSLYNHSYNPNAKYFKKLEDDTLHIIALRNIHSSEEILVNYNGDPSDSTPLWFTADEL